MYTVRKRVIFERFCCADLHWIIRSQRDDNFWYFLNLVQYKVKSLLFIPRDEKLTFQHCFVSLVASATFRYRFWCQKGCFSTPSGKMCISQRGRNVVIVALSGQQRWTREMCSFCWTRGEFNVFLSRGAAEGQKDVEFTEGSTEIAHFPSESVFCPRSASMITSPELRTPFFATRWRKRKTANRNL